MPNNKRRFEDFDPNRSASEDSDFEPGGESHPKKKNRKSSARPAGKSTKSAKKNKKKARYRGSDVTDDDDDDDDSVDELSYNDEDEEEEEVVLNPVTGRPVRGRVANKKQPSYEEKDTSEEEALTSDNSEGGDSEPLAKASAKGRKKRVVASIVEAEDENEDEDEPGPTLLLKFQNLPKSILSSKQRNKSPSKSAKTSPVKRNTRAKSTPRGSRAPSAQRSTRHNSSEPLLDGLPPTTRKKLVYGIAENHEGIAAASRRTRGGKGIAISSTIKEEIHETSSYEQPAEEDNAGEDEIPASDNQDRPESAPQVADEEHDEEQDAGGGEPQDSIEKDGSDDEDEDLLAVRNRRPSRRNIAEEAEDAEEVAGDVEAEVIDLEKEQSGKSRRTRGSKPSKSNRADEASDFEPEDASDDDISDSDARKKRSNSRDDENVSRRGKGRQQASKASSRRRRSTTTDGEDLEEVREEVSDLGIRKTRKRPLDLGIEGIEYGQTSRKRRATENANYKMSQLKDLYAADDELAEQAASQSTRQPKNGRGPAGNWERNLYSTFGPFGGGGGPAPVIGGPWGTGATGGVDSDSSDDEGMMRPSNVGGNVGMTPTSAFPPGLLPTIGQANSTDPFGAASATPNVGKIKSQKALADADPLGVDQNVDFSKVGGLDGHIDQLKEMVMMPLLYPELFQKFKVVPPRGVLFHGPPGTGKTLLARALAASVGSGGKKVTFYMRKGADALSKWVGEAERQLRLLFEEARKTQPSIIFFDEIDGLAPVRSSKQEQIHASIVSTLLALMDGMDGRGQVIVIGATNRPDNIDPALRRPGRFDREFYFPLPGLEARKSIIDINTKDWEVDDAFKMKLADLTKGYGGADLRALCTEAALNSIQRTYPQIYSSNDKLLIDASKIKVNAKDFMLSIKKIIPSSERSTSSGAAALPKVVEPLLRAPLKAIEKILDGLIPIKKKTTALQEAMYEQYDDADFGFQRETMQQDFERSRVFRPRLLICGDAGMGQQYLGGAILNHFEGLHVQSFDLPTIYSDSSRSPETAIVQLFAEVKRHKPSVIYLPAVDTWYHTLPTNVITTFLGLLKAIPPNDPVMVLGITDTPETSLDPNMLRDLFGFSIHNRFKIKRPTRENREEFFQPIIQYARKCPKDFPEPMNRKKRKLDVLPLAPIPPPVPPTKEEIKALKKRDHQILNLLKIQIQPIMDQIQKRYRKFRTPVIPAASILYLYDESDPEFVRADIREERPYELDTDKDGVQGLRQTETGKFFYNLETTTIEERLSNGFYARPKDFLADIKTLARDAKNIGDKERMLKANELVANVEVDIAGYEANPVFADCENVYLRQLKRAKEREEKEKKRATQEEDIFNPIRSDLPAQPSPSRPSAAAPGSVPFLTPLNVSSGMSNGYGASSEHTSNGTSVPSRGGDTQMTDADTGVSQGSPMQPPMNRSLASGQGTQISQRSAWQELSHGTSPSQLVNDASTTTSGKKSSASDGWSRQAINGQSNQYSSPVDRPNQDSSDQANTQLNTQETSSEEWTHSQAHGLARGILPNSNPSQTSSSSQYSQVPAVPPFPAPPRIQPVSRPSGFANLLNEAVVEPTSSQLSSQKDQIIDEAFVADLLRHLVDGSSGCSVEQLEQVYRELMDTLWTMRGEWNRSLVTANLVQIFNATIHDIEAIQKVQMASQPTGSDFSLPLSA